MDSVNSLTPSADARSKQSHKGKSVLYHIPALELLQDVKHEDGMVEDVVTAGDDAPDSEPLRR
jgi:hypothetical protein